MPRDEVNAEFKATSVSFAFSIFPIILFFLSVCELCNNKIKKMSHQRYIAIARQCANMLACYINLLQYGYMVLTETHFAVCI